MDSYVLVLNAGSAQAGLPEIRRQFRGSLIAFRLVSGLRGLRKTDSCRHTTCGASLDMVLVNVVSCRYVLAADQAHQP